MVPDCSTLASWSWLQSVAVCMSHAIKHTHAASEAASRMHAWQWPSSAYLDKHYCHRVPGVWSFSVSWLNQLLCHNRVERALGQQVGHDLHLHNTMKAAAEADDKTKH
jgi:hypothetical protein